MAQLLGEIAMGVIAVWKCDRDGAMFSNKKDAEEHDKMLELAANISSLLEEHITGLSETHSEEIGLYGGTYLGAKAIHGLFCRIEHVMIM